MNARIATIILLMLGCAARVFAQATPLLIALRPTPKTAFARDGMFPIHTNTAIVAPSSPDAVTLRAIDYLNEMIRERMGFTLNVIDPSGYDGGHAIIMGVPAAMPQLNGPLAPQSPRGEMLPETPGGYILDITFDRMTIVGTDPDGLFNAVSTIAQMMIPGDASAFVPCSHIWDYPDFPVRWVFSQHNLRGPGQLASLHAIEDTMAYRKLNGLQQNDFKYNLLGQQPAYYFDSVRALISHSAKRNAAVIPGVAGIGYSDGILWNDRNLAEGFPATARYVVAGDTGRIIPDSNAVLPNGTFESVGGNGKFTGWSFYDDGAVSVETSNPHGGARAARCENFTNGNPSGNCRFSRRIDCQPFRSYRLSAWLRTENLKADMVQLLAIGQDDNNNSRVLTFTQYPSFQNQSGWKQVEVYFNTLGYNHVNLYAGVWGGRSGKIWWDDFAIEDAGMMSILRRDGTPLTIVNGRNGTACREGIDFAPVHDSFLDNPGNPVNRFHAPPTLRRLPGGAIQNGDTLTVSFFHPLTTIVGDDGNGSVMVCVSEDTLYSILRTQIRGVDSLYHAANVASNEADRFFMGHDEIRSLGWDSACVRRGLSAAELLADNVKRCAAIIDDARPGAETYIWSDMFDSLHNAYNNYYLINGDLAGVWDKIPKEITIVNWNGGGNRDKSVDFFSRHGFRQVASPYYDSRGTTGIRDWRLSLARSAGARGMMYTTWALDYDFLTPFSYYAWGAGPYVIHQPIDTAALPPVGASTDTVCFSVTVLPDPYDPADSITDVKIWMQLITGDEIPTVDEIHLTRDSGDTFTGCFPRGPWRGLDYTITATNRQGLRRVTPTYIVRRVGYSGAPADPLGSRGLALAVEPNPARDETLLSFTLRDGGRWSLRVVDLMGNVVMTRDGNGVEGRNVVAVDLRRVASGVYRCEVRSGERRAVGEVRVVR